MIIINFLVTWTCQHEYSISCVDAFLWIHWCCKVSIYYTALSSIITSQFSFASVRVSPQFHQCLRHSCSIRVSNELGAGNPRAAHLAVCVVVVLNITEAFFVGTVMILLRNIWGYAYTKDIEVVKQIAIMLPILAVSYFLDSLQSVLGG